MKSLETVEYKVAEAEFFLQKMCEDQTNYDEFKWYFSAFLTAVRTVQDTFRNNYNDLEGFSRWMRSHKKTLETGASANFFRSLRNINVHGEGYSIKGASFSNSGAVYFFDKDYLEIEKLDTSRGVLAMSREHFVDVLETVYDAFVFFGPEIDSQQYYTKENFAKIGKNIDHAECEIHGWICETLIDEGMGVDDRWHELRSYVGVCKINHLFYSYLGKVTPILLPDYLEEVNASPEDRGWYHIPAGFKSLEEYREIYPLNDN